MPLFSCLHRIRLPEMFFKNFAPKEVAGFTGKHLRWGFFLNKVSGTAINAIIDNANKKCMFFRFCFCFCWVFLLCKRKRRIVEVALIKKKKTWENDCSLFSIFHIHFSQLIYWICLKEFSFPKSSHLGYIPPCLESPYPWKIFDPRKRFCPT